MRTTVARWCGAGAATGIAIAGVFHLLWAFSPWPLGTRREWATTIVGAEDGDLSWSRTELVVACFVVAGALLAAAYIVGVRAGVLRRIGPWWGFWLATWVIAGVFLLRGVAPMDSPEDSFNHWNLVLYRPLCLVIAVLCAVTGTCRTALGDPPAGTARRSASPARRRSPAP